MEKYKIITGNMYSIEDGTEYNFRVALIHYKNKHGLDPTRIIINANDLTEYNDGDTFTCENGKYSAIIVVSPHQPRGRFIVTNDETAGIDEEVL